MFRNITWVRDNTERILERLEAERVADEATEHSPETRTDENRRGAYRGASTRPVDPLSW